MDNLPAWSRFLERQVTASPLHFTHGMRLSVDAGYYCPVHDHPAIEIVYHPTGQGVTTVGKKRQITFAEGGVVIYAAREPHDQLTHLEGEDFCLHLAPGGQSKSLPKTCLHVPFLSDPALIEEINLLSQGHVHPTPMEQALFNFRATSTLLALVHLACHQVGEEPPETVTTHVRKAEQYILQHFARIKSLREVAAHVGISADHLRHAFQAVRKRSMIRYLNEVRIDRARKLLVHSRVPLKEIAGLCGFNDQYYFSAVFQSYTKSSPGRYRSRHAGSATLEQPVKNPP